MAEASLFVQHLPNMTFDKNTQPMLSHINIGTGTNTTIAELADAVRDICGFKGEIIF